MRLKSHVVGGELNDKLPNPVPVRMQQHARQVQRTKYFDSIATICIWVRVPDRHLPNPISRGPSPPHGPLRPFIRAGAVTALRLDVADPDICREVRVAYCTKA